ncbi:MAG: hypothetical protein HKN82_08295 [Akkermansiaceae bacterium]|nr:hypothetical protein [Akkermansiaceae bacterium]NNM29116.1 hypothetical protein [Akkermansiaceae bacterium]
MHLAVKPQFGQDDFEEIVVEAFFPSQSPELDAPLEPHLATDLSIPRARSYS